ncbi:hypothetical protein ACA910_019486 [Epithemia clementina (nom. ined.)]
MRVQYNRISPPGTTTLTAATPSYAANIQDGNTATTNTHQRGALQSTLDTPAHEHQPTNTRQTNIHDHYGNPPTQVNELWGDCFLQKAATSCRIIFQNINGFKAGTTHDFANPHTIALNCDGAQVDILGMAETKVNWSQPVIRNKVYQQFRKVWNPITLATSASTMTYESSFQPGGILTAIRGDWTVRSETPILDEDLG